MPNIQKPKGTLDILPAETPAWQYIEKTARSVCSLYGFSEIKFPTFESTDLFCRGVGSSTDIVQKEMYTFIDKDSSSLTLRPEGTACIARSVVENGLYAGSMPLKMFYFTNFFRRERPQAGRSREFWQFGTEVYGSDRPESDATAISLAYTFLQRLGLSKVILKINTVGCKECRPAYRKALKEYFSQHTDGLCDTCRGRLETNPMRILDCKCPECAKIAENAPHTVDYICEDCKSKFDSLLGMLSDLGIEYECDPKTVRGLDYYTGAVFEFVSGSIGAQSAVCGGGRYDGLTSEIGGPALPAVGFAMGVTRLAMCMVNDGVMPEFDVGADVYIAPIGDAAIKKALVLSQALRNAEIKTDTDLCTRSVKAQMKYANKTNAKYVLVIGDDELANNEITLQNMKTGEKIKLDLSAEAIINCVSVPERG